MRGAGPSRPSLAKRPAPEPAARRHLGAHRRDPAATPVPGRGTERGEDPLKRPP